tara:strand:- start:3 stop:323 length:321 start_codon:yes stop_codon:yes gene_type:complete
LLKILKNITTSILSLFLLATIFHVDHHIGEHQGGYTICDISCDNEKHHLVNHQCQKCLNKNQKLNSIKEIDNLINQRKTRYRIVKNIIDVKSIIFDLNSRPPPSLI